MECQTHESGLAVNGSHRFRRLYGSQGLGTLMQAMEDLSGPKATSVGLNVFPVPTNNAVRRTAGSQ
jgi:hypothetical protein